MDKQSKNEIQIFDNCKIILYNGIIPVEKDCFLPITEAKFIRGVKYENCD